MTQKPGLLTKAEYVSLAVSLVGVPGLALHNSRALNSLACELVKTSQALEALKQELKQVREATFENRAAIYYLLLRQNHGCEEFKGLCCFNLRDSSQLIESDIHHLKELTHKIGYKKNLLIFYPDFLATKLALAKNSYFGDNHSYSCRHSLMLSLSTHIALS